MNNYQKIKISKSTLNLKHNENTHISGSESGATTSAASFCTFLMLLLLTSRLQSEERERLRCFDRRVSRVRAPERKVGSEQLGGGRQRISGVKGGWREYLEDGHWSALAKETGGASREQVNEI